MSVLSLILLSAHLVRWEDGKEARDAAAKKTATREALTANWGDTAYKGQIQISPLTVTL